MYNVLYAIGVALIPFFIVLFIISISFPKLSKSLSTSIQAVATGFILGSVLIDLMPRTLVNGNHFSYIISFVIGFLLMLWLQSGSNSCCSSTNNKKPLLAFLTPFALEFFITGLLIGITANISTMLAILITLSFTLCNSICSLSIATRLSVSNIAVLKRFRIALCMALLLPIGAFIGSFFINAIPITWINDLISFAIACLLSLVFIELFPEAISQNKQKGISIMFGAMTLVFLLNYLL